jgi:hypothetical protein
MWRITAAAERRILSHIAVRSRVLLHRSIQMAQVRTKGQRMTRKEAKVARAAVCDSGKACREVGLSSSEAPLSVVDVPTHVRI